MVVSEDRVPLSERINGDWTAFEKRLFNMLGDALLKEAPDLEHVLFSKRLWMTQRMLDSFDACLVVLRGTGVQS